MRRITRTIAFVMIFLILTGIQKLQAQQPAMGKDNFSTLYGQFSRTVDENSLTDSTQGEFYYVGSSKMYIEVNHPIHQIMTFSNRTMVLYYPESKQAFLFKTSNPMILPLVPGLKAAIRADYGLKEMGLRLEDQKIRGDTLISYWAHPKGRDKLGQYKVVEVKDRLQQTEFEIPDLTIRNITTFTDYIEVSGMIFPSHIISDISNAEGFVIEKVTLKNLKVDLKIPDHVRKFSIPKDVKIVERKW